MNDMPVYRILVIDDNPSIHHDFIKILNEGVSSEIDYLGAELFGKKEEKIPLPHFEIEVASQGQEGLVKVQKALEEGNPYSLAFVDIRMPPGWDGVETIKHIWELDKNIQIVICTAYSDYSWEETVNNLGMTDNLLILKKPFDTISVRQLASALTKKWELAGETRQHTSLLQQQVSERTLSLQQSLKELRHQATHDYLTGLDNRVRLNEEMQKAIKTAAEQHNNFAVLFFDLDRFKLINDSLSHAVGDELLKLAANRLNEAIPNKDILARLGGDEFVVVMQYKAQKEIEEHVKKINEVFRDPFVLEGREIILTVSIGISLYPQHGDNPELLLRNADAAMYRAKALKGNANCFYSPEMNKESLDKLDQEMELRRALVNNEFFLVYQPQVEIRHEKLIAVEALIRWKHPTKGVLLPLEFIPLAEETGLIIPMGEWAMRAACMQNKAWQNAGYTPIRVAINITAQQFKQYNLVEKIKTILKQTKLDPQYLELELTENVILSNPEIMRVISELKKLGVIIAIDDFGTGYSTLSYLHKIPLDRLKIDSSFIQHIKSDNDDEVIIRAIIELAKNLNLEVLAEGVETQEQLEFLKKNECPDVQGFYFSKPLTSAEVENYFGNPQKLVKNEIKNKG